MSRSNQESAGATLVATFVISLIVTAVFCFFIGIFTDVSLRCACWAFLIFFLIGNIVMMGVGAENDDGVLVATGLSLAAVSAVGMLLLTFTKGVQWGPSPDSLKEQLKQAKRQVEQKDAELDSMNTHWAQRVNSLQSRLEENGTASRAAESPDQSSLQAVDQTLSAVSLHLESRLRPAIQQLTRDRYDLRSQLQDMGIESSDDLNGNNRARLLSEELAEVVFQLSLLEQKKNLYEQSQFELQTLQRRLKRHQLSVKAGLSDSQIKTVKTTLKTIETRLNDTPMTLDKTAVLDVDRVLQQELKQQASAGFQEKGIH